MMRRGELAPSNAALVERLATLARTLDREPWNVASAEAALQLPAA